MQMDDGEAAGRVFFAHARELRGGHRARQRGRQPLQARIVSDQQHARDRLLDIPQSPQQQVGDPR